MNYGFIWLFFGEFYETIFGGGDNRMFYGVWGEMRDIYWDKILDIEGSLFMKDVMVNRKLIEEILVLEMMERNILGI